MTASDGSLAAGAGVPNRNGRRIAFSVLSAIFAAGALGGLFGVGLVIGWFDNADGKIHRVHDIGFGVLYGVILTVALVVLVVRPGNVSAFYQVVATAAAGLLGGLVSTDASYLILGVIVAVAALILLALHPGRGEVLHPALDLIPVLSVFALAGSVPLVWLALTMARLQRTGSPLDPHVQMDHWANMAAMAFGLALVGLLASCGMRGWRVSAWCAGLGAAVFGLASIVFHRFPGTDIPYAGSVGTGWGLVAVVGGLAFVAVAEWQAHVRRQGTTR